MSRQKPTDAGSPTVALFALDERLHRAQRSLLRAFEYRVIDHDSFADLLKLNPRDVDCISVDLYGLEMSPGQCLRRIREAGLDMPVVLLSGDLPSTTLRGRDVGPADGGSAYLLLQPVDIELYLKTLRSLIAQA